VYESRRADRVLKLTVDQSTVAYLTDERAPRGLHKPKVYHNIGPIGATRYGAPLMLLEIERLHRIRRNSPNGELVRNIVRFVDAQADLRFAGKPHSGHALPKPEDRIAGLSRSLARFMQRLEAFSRTRGCPLEVCTDSFMQRDDATLVLNDPVCDGHFFHF
jgi:hypothetical protein